mmetsp:Transcript_40641/g.107689  ORF Transcript_40641/g.107689 Transcript_40641/m.107689 type:complete len:121 (-) Transcript_40641:257-619(-)
MFSLHSFGLLAFVVLAVARNPNEKECIVAAKNCRRDFSRKFCAPLDLHVDKPISFMNGELNFPAVPLKSERDCKRYLSNHGWTKSPGAVDYSRTDWDYGSCDCSEEYDHEVLPQEFDAEL